MWWGADLYFDWLAYVANPAPGTLEYTIGHQVKPIFDQEIPIGMNHATYFGNLHANELRHISSAVFGTVHPYCGDGTLISPEQCDDHNYALNDGCNTLCQYSVIVNITSPANNATLPTTGNVSIATSASYVTALSSIAIYVDDVLKKTCSFSTQLSGTCSFSQNVSQLTSGQHTFKAVATSATGKASAQVITVTKP
jgi:cysteine-rich repeat protein